MLVKLKPNVTNLISADDVISIELNDEELLLKIDFFNSWCGVEKHYYGDCARVIYHFFNND